MPKSSSLARSETRSTGTNFLYCNRGWFWSSKPSGPVGPGWNLPDLLFERIGRRGPTWSKQAKDEEAQVNAIIDELLLEVCESNDTISKGLELIFSKAVPETEEELTSARLRKELGNPPGKRSDPLGDQLSWTQFLNRLNPGDEIWILTHDTDYHAELNKALRLNSFLMAELLDRGIKSKDIHVFDNLVQGLAAFSKAAPTPVKSLPSSEVLQAAAKEERESQPRTLWVYDPLELERQGFSSRVNAAKLGESPWFNTPASGFNFLALSPSGSNLISLPENWAQYDVPEKDIKPSGKGPWFSFPTKPAKPGMRIRKRRGKQHGREK
jgi:hypothetical protein